MNGHHLGSKVVKCSFLMSYVLYVLIVLHATTIK